MNVDSRANVIADIKRLRDRKYRTPRGMRYALNGRDRVLLDYVIANLIDSGNQLANAERASTARRSAAQKTSSSNLHDVSPPARAETETP